MCWVPPFPRWRWGQARTQTDRLRIEWSWTKPVTLTCQIGDLANGIIENDLSHSIGDSDENETNFCIFSAGENLDVYRATLGHKVCQYHSSNFLTVSVSWMSELNDLNLSESSLTTLILDKLCWNCTIFFDPGLPQFSTECGDRRVLPSKIRPHQMHCHSAACECIYCQIIAYMFFVNFFLKFR